MEQVQCSRDVTKATGPDGIFARMLKETANTISTSVAALFNWLLHTGCVPVDWKRSKNIHVTEPWGTPEMTGLKFEAATFTTTP